MKLTKESAEQSKTSRMILRETTYCPSVEPKRTHCTQHSVLSRADGIPQLNLLKQQQTISWTFCLLAQIHKSLWAWGTDVFSSSLTCLQPFRPCHRQARYWAVNAELRLSFRGNYTETLFQCQEMRHFHEITPTWSTPTRRLESEPENENVTRSWALTLEML